MIRVVGYDMAKAARREGLRGGRRRPRGHQGHRTPRLFRPNELISYEALGLCAEAFVEVGDNTYGGRVVTNPSGGLLSKGHPLAATGLAHCYELVRQVRWTAGPTQVEPVRHGLQHNLGLGGP